MNISVVIPVYNAENYLSKTLDSVINQTNNVDEIICIDDCSQDNSFQVLERYASKYKHIKIIRNEMNIGVAASRNKGVQLSSCEWILFLDADDLIAPTLVECYRKMDEKDNFSMLYSQYTQIDKLDNAISAPMEASTVQGFEGFCTLLLRNTIISPSGCLVNKSVIDSVGGFDEKMWSAEDVDLWLRILLDGHTIRNVNFPLTFIRRHTNNTTNSLKVTNIGEQALLNKYDLAFMKDLIYKRELKLEQNHMDFVNFLIRYEKFEEALILINESDFEEIHPLYTQSLFLKFLIHIKLLRLNEAKEVLLELLAIDPLHGAALNNLGIIESENKNFKQAESLFKKALEIFPGYLDAEYNLEQLEKESSNFKFTFRELRKNLLQYR